MSSQFDRIFENAGKIEIDPVCGMSVKADQPSGGYHEHEGTTYELEAAINENTACVAFVIMTVPMTAYWIVL